MRFYEDIGNDKFDVLIRHKELPEELRGTYRLAQLEKCLSFETE